MVQIPEGEIQHYEDPESGEMVPEPRPPNSMLPCNHCPKGENGRPGNDSLWMLSEENERVVDAYYKLRGLADFSKPIEVDDPVLIENLSEVHRIVGNETDKIRAKYIAFELIPFLAIR